LFEVDVVGGVFGGGFDLAPGMFDFGGTIGFGEAREVEDFALYGAEDVAESDFAGSASKDVATGFTAMALDEAGAFQFEEDLDEVIGGDALTAGDLVDAERVRVRVVKGEGLDSPAGVIAFDASFHILE
jgi:hypothetical protein